MQIEAIHTAAAASPLGHYSQAVRSGGFIFLSGLLPVGKQGSVDATLSFEQQARRVLRYARAILNVSGSGFGDVAKVNVYIPDIRNWAAFDAIYAEHVRPHRPARAVIPVTELHHGFGIEIDLIAVDSRSDRFSL